MNFFRIFIYSIVLLKIIYLFFILIDFYFKYDFKKHPEHTDSQKKEKTTAYIKNKVDKIFTISVALLLVILFYPHNNNKLIIDHETKRILFLFGIVLIIKELGLLV